MSKSIPYRSLGLDHQIRHIRKHNHRKGKILVRVNYFYLVVKRNGKEIGRFRITRDVHSILQKMKVDMLSVLE